MWKEARNYCQSQGIFLMMKMCCLSDQLSKPVAVAEDHLGFYHSETWTSLRVMMKIFCLNPINEKTTCKVFQISRSGSPEHFQRTAAGVHHREGLTLTNVKL